MIQTPLITSKQLLDMKQKHDVDCGVGAFRCTCPAEDKNYIIDLAANAIEALEKRVKKLESKLQDVSDSRDWPFLWW